MIFSIVCRCEKEINKQDIINVVKSIRHFHPIELIVIIDSNSPDKSYFDDLKDVFNLKIEDIGNDGYETGAMWYVYEKYVSDTYFFMQDSMELKKSLNEYMSDDVRVINTYVDWKAGKPEEKEFAKLNMLKSDYEYKENNFAMLQFNSLLVKRHVLDKLKQKNFHKIIPYDKVGSCAMERILGMALTDDGHDLKNKLFKPGTIEKIWRNRQ